MFIRSKNLRVVMVGGAAVVVDGGGCKHSIRLPTVSGGCKHSIRLPTVK